MAMDVTGNVNAKCDPAARWQELAGQGATMLPGPEPDTAVRVRVESCERGGCVHLEQMAFSRTLGWYRQKSFSVPRTMVGELARLLRMGDCLLPGVSETSGPAATEVANACDDRTAPLKFPAAPPHERQPARHRKRSG